MSLTPFHFAIFKPGEINGFLQAQNSVINAILNNYTEVYTKPPVLHDDSLQVFAVQIEDEDLKEVVDGLNVKRFIWRGDKTSRPKPQDKITVPILPVATVIGAASASAPVDQARTVFSGYPGAIQMALVIAAQDPTTLSSILPEGVLTEAQLVQISAWAKANVDAFTASQASA